MGDLCDLGFTDDPDLEDKFIKNAAEIGSLSQMGFTQYDEEILFNTTAGTVNIISNKRKNSQSDDTSRTLTVSTTDALNLDSLTNSRETTSFQISKSQSIFSNSNEISSFEPPPPKKPRKNAVSAEVLAERVLKASLEKSEKAKLKLKKRQEKLNKK